MLQTNKDSPNFEYKAIRLINASKTMSERDFKQEILAELESAWATGLTVREQIVPPLEA